MFQRKARVGSRPMGGGNRSSSNRRSSGGGRGRSSNLMDDVSRFVKRAVQTDETASFRPEHRFADLPIHPKLKANIAKRNYVDPTPIQDGAIPHILTGRDVIGIANTGTGKTAAFLIPLIDKVFRNIHQEFVLILVPTRELANQINKEFQEFSVGSGLRSAIVIGGAHMHGQVRDLRLKPNFMIGTPGRVKDLIERRLMDISNVNTVVLDEVDRMLDMGFVRDIKHLLSMVKKERQSLFFSATIEAGVREIANSILKDPVTVFVKARATSENVHQDVVHIKTKEEKVETLHELLLKDDFRKVLVFSKTKRGAEKLSKTLIERGFQASAIHGDLSQGQRERSLIRFRQDAIRVLVATDVAARGLDIDGITHVINYDLPMTYEDYIHRIGRTGRGNSIGQALTFIEHFVSEESFAMHSRSRSRFR